MPTPCLPARPPARQAASIQVPVTPKAAPKVDLEERRRRAEEERAHAEEKRTRIEQEGIRSEEERRRAEEEKLCAREERCGNKGNIGLRAA